jgi:hypothetical protein
MRWRVSGRFELLRGERSHCDDRGPADDMSGLAAEEPVHGHDWYRLIRPGQRHFLTIEQVVVCLDCVRGLDDIRLDGGLTVEVGGGRLQVRRGSAAAGDGGRSHLS